MQVELRILHGLLGSESHAAARTLARQAPADFNVSLAELKGELRDVDRALDDGRASLVLLLSHAAAPAVRAAARKCGAATILVTTFHTPWPGGLPAFFEAYEASDALLVSDRDLWDCTGRLPGTSVLPSGHDEPARGIYDAVRTAATPSLSTRMDLSTEVTVFVTTIGAPSYPACRELLRRQDCTFTMHLLEGITPLSAALQQMLDRCRTPYYVQVDEDMLLYPHAVRTLYERMSSSPPDVAIVVGQLYDVHVERCIQGVKLARHAIARQYPWADQPNVLRRLERLAADGHHVLELPAGEDGRAAGALGLHGTHATPEMLYDRYLTLERLRRSSPRQLEWFEPVPARFLRRFLAAPTEADLHALLGILAGAVAGPLPEGAEVRDGGARNLTDRAPSRRQLEMVGFGPRSAP